MKRDIRDIPISDLLLDERNTRFAGDVASNQKEAMSLLLADPKEAKELVELALHIAQNGLDPSELQLVLPSNDNKYIVLEGNRRTTALKLLLNPSACPNTNIYPRFLEASKKLAVPMPSSVECSVVSTREEGEKWKVLKHTAGHGGAGRTEWSSEAREEFRFQQTGEKSIGRQIRELVTSNSNYFDSDVVSGVNSIPITILTRLFSSRPAQDYYGLKNDAGTLVNIHDLKYIAPSLNYSLLLFKDHGYNTNHIRNHEDRQDFVSKIPEELLPSYLMVNDQSNSPSSGSFDKHDNEQNNVSSENTINNNGGKVSFEEKPENSETKNTENEKPKKPRSRPDERLRKKLINWPLSINNPKINALYGELKDQKFDVDKFPNAAAVAFRVLIETSSDHYLAQLKENNVIIDLEGKVLEQEGRELKSGSRLSHKIKGITKYLESEKLLTKECSRDIIRRATSENTSGSMDHFNMFVHGISTIPNPIEIKIFATAYRPYLEAIWN